MVQYNMIWHASLQLLRQWPCSITALTLNLWVGPQFFSEMTFFIKTLHNTFSWGGTLTSLWKGVGGVRKHSLTSNPFSIMLLYTDLGARGFFFSVFNTALVYFEFVEIMVQYRTEKATLTLYQCILSLLAGYYVCMVGHIFAVSAWGTILFREFENYMTREYIFIIGNFDPRIIMVTWHLKSPSTLLFISANNKASIKSFVWGFPSQRTSNAQIISMSCKTNIHLLFGSILHQSLPWENQFDANFSVILTDVMPTFSLSMLTAANSCHLVVGW